MALKALIIDDNTNNIEVLKQLLQIEGITGTHIVSDNSLEETLSQLESIDIIFLDLEMPKYNGYEVFEILQQYNNLGNPKVVAYSVHVSEVKTALNKGFDAFLGKPLNAEDFSEQLTRILNGEKIHYLP
ncbi:MAG: response regulator [Chloroflexota bacterium]